MAIYIFWVCLHISVVCSHHSKMISSTWMHCIYIFLHLFYIVYLFVCLFDKINRFQRFYVLIVPCSCLDSNGSMWINVFVYVCTHSLLYKPMINQTKRSDHDAIFQWYKSIFIERIISIFDWCPLQSVVTMPIVNGFSTLFAVANFFLSCFDCLFIDLFYSMFASNCDQWNLNCSLQNC